MRNVRTKAALFTSKLRSQRGELLHGIFSLIAVAFVSEQSSSREAEDD